MRYYCAGMIRSGSTLQYNIVSDLLETCGMARRTGIVGSEERLEGLILAGDNAVVKIHNAMPTAIADARSGNARVVYIHRDLRDVAASIMQKNREQLRTVLESGRLEQAWDNYLAWTGLEDVLVQRYEEAAHDLPRMVTQIAAYLGVEAAPEVVERVASANNLESRRRELRSRWSTLDRLVYPVRRRVAAAVRTVIGEEKTRRIGVRLGTVGAPRIDEYTQIHTNHIATGVSGSFREVMSEREQALIEDAVRGITAA